MAKIDFSKGDFAIELNTIQPVTDDFSSDGQQEQFSRIDHQHALSPSLRNAIFGTGGTAATAGSKFGRRNLLDNGEMKISQRTGTGNTASIATTYAGCYADRWNFAPTLGTSVIYPSYPNYPVSEEFSTSMGLDSGAATKAVLAAGDYSYIRQGIEGFNIQHLKWGTSEALPLVFSFWASSSTPQTIIIELESGNVISRSVTLTATFTKYQVTFPGYIGGAPTNDSVGRLFVNIWVAAGTTYNSGTLNTIWSSGGASRATGCGNIFATANRLLWLTGCQLEVGTIATPFEHLKYNNELDNCQRYFERWARAAGDLPYAVGQCYTATGAFLWLPYTHSKRGTPTIISSAANTFGLWTAGTANVACTGIVRASGINGIRIQSTVAAGLVAGNATMLVGSAANASYIEASSEI